MNRKRDVFDTFALRLLPDKDQPIALGIGEWAQEHGMDHAEDRRIRANAEAQCEDGDHRESGVLAHHAQPVDQVLLQNFPVLARRCPEYSGDRLAPQFQKVHWASSFLDFALLLVEQAFHLVPVIRLEIKG